MSDDKNKGWEYLNSDDDESYYGDDGSWGYKNEDGTASFYGADGSWGYKNEDGSGSYYGADGSWGTINSDGSYSFYGADGSSDFRDADAEDDDDVNSSADSSDGGSLLGVAVGLGLIGIAAAIIGKRNSTSDSSDDDEDDDDENDQSEENQDDTDDSAYQRQEELRRYAEEQQRQEKARIKREKKKALRRKHWNPPFSLFRDFVNWVFEAKKNCIIIGTIGAAIYKEIFPLIKNNELWIGATNNGKDMVFEVPEGANVDPKDRDKAARLGYVGNYTRLGNACWYTNINHGRRHQPLNLMTMADNVKFSKHRNFVWMCRNRFKSGIYCRNTRLYEEKLPDIICKMATAYISEHPQVLKLCEQVVQETGNEHLLPLLKKKYIRNFEQDAIEE